MKVLLISVGAEVCFISTQNDFGGFYNAPNYVNDQTFAILKADGSITTWGGLIYGTGLIE
jgi:hypothetical protein